jgi:hypothetical protein
MNIKNVPVIFNKFLVLKREDISRYLTEQQILNLGECISAVQVGRQNDGKNPVNDYWVVNQDEPYAKKILQAILRGEKTKERVDAPTAKAEEAERSGGRRI